MSTQSALEVQSMGPVQGLARRILDGEVVVLRRALQQSGLYDAFVQATLKGIRSVIGDEKTYAVERDGFDRIHERVTPAEIPAVTDAVYEVMTAMAHTALQALTSRLFADAGVFYFERSPNVRFHIPYDLAANQRTEYRQFAQRHGDGKITAHGPHRDPWVDCPDNAINIWMALGPVRRGNGLTIFKDEYRKQFAFRDGYIDSSVSLHRPLNFELEAGDAVLFHSNHLHGSELNRTDRTRYVVSYRITFGKPHYPHGHYHHYLHAGLAAGRLRWLAGIPQNLQWSFLRYQFHRLRYKIVGRGKMSGSDASMVQTASKPLALPENGSILLADFPIGTIRAISEDVCVARFGVEHFAAVSRRCSHMGGDLAGGWVDEGKIVCPLHSLSFDPRSGKSPCSSLRPLKRYTCDVRTDRVYTGLEIKRSSLEDKVLSGASKHRDA